MPRTVPTSPKPGGHARSVQRPATTRRGTSASGTVVMLSVVVIIVALVIALGASGLIK
ncbi:MAG TPA: hypothetical protein VFZ25_20730 [Chloroflexota bacterium]|nr:hypothetical protein [Chloroflexota bacterium]